jgi:hypothetical protein
MTSEQIKKLIDEKNKVAAWNKKYSIGQAVTVPSITGTGPRIATTTSSRAFLLHGETAGVYCGSACGFFPLDVVEIFNA